MGVVVHGEVRQPGPGVGVHHHLVPLHAVDDDGLAGHAVLVVVLVVLVEDGRDLLRIQTSQGLVLDRHFIKTQSKLLVEKVFGRLLMVLKPDHYVIENVVKK